MRTLAHVIGLFAATSLTLTACSAGSQSHSGSGQSSQDTLTAALVDAPSNLDFTSTAGAAIPTLLMNNVYETLVKVNAKGELEPLLAKEWAVSEDGMTITFNLVDNATFSTGEAFNADTAIFTLERLRDGAWKSSKAEPMKVIDTVSSLDPHTLVVKLKKPSQQFLFTLATHVGAMMHPDHVANLSEEAIGTGPYVVSSFLPTDKAELTVRDNPRNPVAIKKATMRYIADATTAVNALRSGDVDLLWTMQATQQLEALKKDFNVVEGETTNKVMLIFNNAKAPFNDANARKAVAAAINPSALISGVSDGSGKMMTAPVATTDPWHLTDGGPVFNIDEAKKLAESAGLNRFEIKTPTMPYAQANAELINAQLGEAGIVASIANVEFPAVWLDEVYKNKDFEATIIAHVEPRDLPTLVDPEYYWGVKDSSITEQLVAADAMTDATAYAQAMKDVVKELQNQMIAVPLYQMPNTVVMKKNVQGVQADQPIPNLDVTAISFE